MCDQIARRAYDNIAQGCRAAATLGHRAGTTVNPERVARRPASPGAIPNVPLVKLDGVFFQRALQFLLTRHPPMVFLLRRTEYDMRQQVGKRLRHRYRASETPLGFAVFPYRVPRVAAAPQPWAMLCKPFGLLTVRSASTLVSNNRRTTLGSTSTTDALTLLRPSASFAASPPPRPTTATRS